MPKSSLLNVWFVTKTRQYHALEHATIQILNRSFPLLRLAGWSTPNGFYVYGPVSTSQVQAAATEALYRLHRGEDHLAIHPRCGTNLVTAGILVGLVAFLTMLPGDTRSRRERLPLVMLLSTLVLLLAQPLGLLVQVTTLADLDGQETIRIDRLGFGQTHFHRVQLSHRDAA
jgi:hypothetical protein